MKGYGQERKDQFRREGWILHTSDYIVEDHE